MIKYFCTFCFRLINLNILYSVLSFIKMFLTNCHSFKVQNVCFVGLIVKTKSIKQNLF